MIETTIKDRIRYHSEQDYAGQIEELRERLKIWIEENINKIKAAIFCFRGLGKEYVEIILYLVQKEPGYDDKLMDASTDLDLQLANDPKLNLISFDVREVPPIQKPYETYLNLGIDHEVLYESNA